VAVIETWGEKDDPLDRYRYGELGELACEILSTFISKRERVLRMLAIASSFLRPTGSATAAGGADEVADDTSSLSGGGSLYTHSRLRR
jgi:hypothetical protein